MAKQQLGKQAQDKVIEQAKYVSRLPRSVPPQRPRYPIGGGGGGGQVAVVKTTITARGTGGANKRGTGTVTFKVEDADGVYQTTRDDVAVSNPYATSLPVGRWITLVNANGKWTVIGSDCPAT